MTNDLLRARREAMTSPSGSAAGMSRRELAQAVNEYIRATTGRAGTLGREQVWRWERGVARWPGKAYREALRAVLGAASDADLGFVRTPRTARTVDPRVSDTGDVGQPAPGRGPHVFAAGDELTVRALIRSRGRVLVIRDQESGRLTLPGGLVGEGMPVQDSLKQHVAHQTGLRATVVGFAGAVERHGIGRDVVRRALTLVFEAQPSSAITTDHAITTDQDVVTDHEVVTDQDVPTVRWLTVEGLARHDVRPVALRDALEQGVDGPFWRVWAE